MSVQLIVLFFSGFAYLIMNALLILGIVGMRRGLRLFRHLDALQAFDASDQPLPDSEIFKDIASELEIANFKYLGNFRVAGPDESGHVEYVYTAPNKTTYASVATIGNYLNIGLFTLFGEEACVETHLAQGPDARGTQITKPNYILQTFDEEMPVGTLYKKHKQAARVIKDTEAKPTVIETMDDLLAIEDIYINHYTRRRLRLTFQPGPIPVMVIAVFYIPLSFLFLQGLATELQVQFLLTVLLPLSIIVAAVALGLVGMFMVVSRRSG